MDSSALLSEASENLSKKEVLSCAMEQLEVLSARQEALLLELSSFEAAPAFEARRAERVAPGPSRLGWLRALAAAAGAADAQQRGMAEALQGLEAERRELERKTHWLRGHCQALEEQHELQAYGQQVSERLAALSVEPFMQVRKRSDWALI